MSEIKPDYVWPRLLGNEAKKPGPWTPAKEYCNYKTSYNYAFPKVTHPEFFIEPTEHVKCGEPKELERDVVLTNYRTTYNSNHDWKFLVLEPLNQNYMPPFHSFNFLKEFDERCRTRLPRQRVRASETKVKYPRHTEPNLSGVIVDQKPKMFCPIKGLTRDDVTKIDVSEPGYGKHLDIYLSTAHMDYVHHKPKVLERYRTSDVYVKPAFPPRPQEFVIMDKGAESVLRTINYQNPLQKSCSETIACFQTPKPMVSPIVDCLIPNIKQSFGEVMATPGMYHTEYSHLGHNCRRKPLPLKQLRYLDHLEKIRSVKNPVG